MELGMEKCADEEKWEKRNCRRNRTKKCGNNAWREVKYLRILEADTIKQVVMEEKTRVPQKNDKTPWNKVLKQKSHQSDKHLGSPHCKIFRTIFKTDKGGIQTNGPKDKKVDDYEQSFTSERWHWPSECVKQRRKEDSPALEITLMHQYKESSSSLKRAKRD